LRSSIVRTEGDMKRLQGSGRGSTLVVLLRRGDIANGFGRVEEGQLVMAQGLDADAGRCVGLDWH
jgi:hypothetical protein